MRTIVVFLLGSVAFLCGCSIVGSGGADYLVRGEVGFLSLDPSGDISLSQSGLPISVKTSVKDLGLDDDEAPTYAKASFRFGSNELSLSGFQTDFSGSATIPAGASFGDILSGTAVSSSLDLTNLKLIYRWYLVDFDVLSFGPGLGVDYLDLDAKVTSTLAGTSEDFDPKVPIPVPGVSAELRLGPFRGFTDLYAIQANVGDSDGAFYDLEAGFRFAPLANVDAVVGYRVIRFQASGEDDGLLGGTQTFDVDYKLPGLFFSAGVRF